MGRDTVKSDARLDDAADTGHTVNDSSSDVDSHPQRCNTDWTEGDGPRDTDTWTSYVDDARATAGLSMGARDRREKSSAVRRRARCTVPAWLQSSPASGRLHTDTNASEKIDCDTDTDGRHAAGFLHSTGRQEREIRRQSTEGQFAFHETRGRSILRQTARRRRRGISQPGGAEGTEDNETPAEDKKRHTTDEKGGPQTDNRQSP